VPCSTSWGSPARRTTTGSKQTSSFAAEVAAAKEAGTEFLEDVARKRAVESSDTLLIFLLKARKPEMYRDTQRLEHTGIDGTPLTVVITERPDGPQ